MKPELPGLAEALPPIHPVWSALRMLLQAWLMIQTRKVGERFLMALEKVVDDSATVHPLYELRPSRERGEVLRGQRLAAAWLRGIMPLLWGSLPKRRR